MTLFTRNQNPPTLLHPSRLHPLYYTHVCTCTRIRMCIHARTPGLFITCVIKCVINSQVTQLVACKFCFSCRIIRMFSCNVHVYACSYVKLYVYMYVIRFILTCNLQLTNQNAGFVTAMLFRHTRFVMRDSHEQCQRTWELLGMLFLQIDSVLHSVPTPIHMQS